VDTLQFAHLFSFPNQDTCEMSLARASRGYYLDSNDYKEVYNRARLCARAIVEICRPLVKTVDSSSGLMKQRLHLGPSMY